MGNDRRLRTKIPIRSSRKIAIEGTNTSCDGDKTHQTTQESSQASKRPESACLQLPNDRRAVQYSHTLFIVGQPVQSSETPTPGRVRVTPRLYQGIPATRVVPERPTARQRGESKRHQRTGQTLSAPGRVENSKIKPLFLGNQEPQKNLCNRDIGPVSRSLDFRSTGNDGISEHALVQPNPPQRVRVPSHNLRNPKRQAAKIIGRRRDQSAGQLPAFA